MLTTGHVDQNIKVQWLLEAAIRLFIGHMQHDESGRITGWKALLVALVVLGSPELNQEQPGA